MTSAHQGMASERATVSSVVERIGAGPAQLGALFFGTGGVNFCDGIELMLGNVIVTSVSKDFGLGPNERALMSTMTLLGLMVGHFCSGYVGDTWGRRTPVLWCYILTFVLGFVCAFQPTFCLLVCARCLVGVAMGFGMPPAAAMISEITPEWCRISMRVGVTICFSLGFLLISLLAAFDDPSLENLHWRHLMLIGALPPAVFMILCFFFLYESPVFLAAVGKHAEAKKVFRSMAWMNSTDHCDLDYSVPSKADAPTPALDEAPQTTLCEQMRMVFSPQLWFTTVAVFWAAFCINLAAYGDGYAAPQILGETSSFPPAWRCVIKSATSVLWTLVAGVLARAASRKTMVIASTTISATVCFAFAVAGPCPAPRPLLLAMLYQYGANGSAIGAAFGYVVIFQIAVEIYPTAASSTGGALIMGGGRVAAVAAPLLFENFRQATGDWTSFYYFMGASCVSASIAVQCMPSVKAYRPGEKEEADMEHGKVLLKAPLETAMNYGSAAKPR